MGEAGSDWDTAQLVGLAAAGPAAVCVPLLGASLPLPQPRRTSGAQADASAWVGCPASRALGSSTVLPAVLAIPPWQPPPALTNDSSTVSACSVHEAPSDPAWQRVIDGLCRAFPPPAAADGAHHAAATGQQGGWHVVLLALQLGPQHVGALLLVLPATPKDAAGFEGAGTQPPPLLRPLLSEPGALAALASSVADCCLGPVLRSVQEVSTCAARMAACRGVRPMTSALCSALAAALSQEVYMEASVRLALLPGRDATRGILLDDAPALPRCRTIGGRGSVGGAAGPGAALMAMSWHPSGQQRSTDAKLSAAVQRLLTEEAGGSGRPPQVPSAHRQIAAQGQVVRGKYWAHASSSKQLRSHAADSRMGSVQCAGGHASLINLRGSLAARLLTPPGSPNAPSLTGKAGGTISQQIVEHGQGRSTAAVSSSAAAASPCLRISSAVLPTIASLLQDASQSCTDVISILSGPASWRDSSTASTAGSLIALSCCWEGLTCGGLFQQPGSGGPDGSGQLPALVLYLTTAAALPRTLLTAACDCVADLLQVLAPAALHALSGAAAEEWSHLRLLAQRGAAAALSEGGLPSFLLNSAPSLGAAGAPGLTSPPAKAPGARQRRIHSGGVGQPLGAPGGTGVITSPTRTSLNPVAAALLSSSAAAGTSGLPASGVHCIVGSPPGHTVGGIHGSPVVSVGDLLSSHCASGYRPANQPNGAAHGSTGGGGGAGAHTAARDLARELALEEAFMSNDGSSTEAGGTPAVTQQGFADVPDAAALALMLASRALSDGASEEGQRQAQMSLLLGSFQAELDFSRAAAAPAGGLHAEDDVRALRLQRALGTGADSVVMLADLHGGKVAVKLIVPPDACEAEAQDGAAPGSPDPERLQERRRQLLRSVRELAVLSSVSHPNIVQVYSWSTRVVPPEVPRPGDASPANLTVVPEGEPAPGPLCTALVMEFCDMGSLADAIDTGLFHKAAARAAAALGRNARAEGAGGTGLLSSSPHDSSRLGRPPGPVAAGNTPQRLAGGAALRAVYLTLLEVAMALRHLHALNLVHCDVKPANVLLRSSASDPRGFTTKLSDFGFVDLMQPRAPSGDGAALGEGGEEALVEGRRCALRFPDRLGTLTHQAPEIFLQGAAVDASVDIYAYGILMWELLTGRAPYQAYAANSFLDVPYKVVLEGLRPALPADAPLDYRALAQDCWASQPAQRPTAAALVARVQRLLDLSCGAAQG
ncbi:hypothetical protein HYH03_016597 [Edaphochlamys debaryana]|uniref:Protein kinase domain-containing protein n=1 Tax=Edaphochlamys debaryana TaxID=47281 RepID=A0A836BRB7_9CHLO|nr:hypothetical protein HYH03_016597 [Edaphochlamys debaryana]|eukprot:KAG2484644.1 hypothetical protein HYH03_016597 [Edaphochlamys debaryana]